MFNLIADYSLLHCITRHQLQVVSSIYSHSLTQHFIEAAHSGRSLCVQALSHTTLYRGSPQRPQFNCHLYCHSIAHDNLLRQPAEAADSMSSILLLSLTQHIIEAARSGHRFSVISILLLSHTGHCMKAARSGRRLCQLYCLYSTQNTS